MNLSNVMERQSAMSPAETWKCLNSLGESSVLLKPSLLNSTRQDIMSHGHFIKRSFQLLYLPALRDQEGSLYLFWSWSK